MTQVFCGFLLRLDSGGDAVKVLVVWQVQVRVSYMSCFIYVLFCLQIKYSN